MPPPAYCVARTFPAEPTTTYRFDRHYLLYALKGSMRLEVKERSWSLPPARAAWIAAGADITVTLDRPVDVCSLLFATDVFARPRADLTVFEMTPLLRELVRELRPFGPELDDLPPEARQLFDTAAMLAERACDRPSPASMPSGRSDPVRRALAETEARLADEAIDFATIAAAAHLTPRTLARRFETELGMTWRQAQRQLRMIRAIEALSEGDRAVTDIAISVGYASPSAFNAAFRDFTGLAPGAWRDGTRRGGSAA